MPDRKHDVAKLERAARETIVQFEDEIIRMARGPGRGTILVEMVNDPGREHVKFKPTPYYENRGGEPRA